MPPHNIKTGNIGEDLACDYLRDRKYKIIARNCRKPWGELDIVALAPDKTLVFVEVKTVRGREPFVSAERQMSPQKLRRFKRAASFYAGEKLNQKLVKNEKGWRLDLIAIYLDGFGEPTFRHYENVF